jgi:hypothetical protein
MQLQVEFWQLLGIAGAFVAALSGVMLKIGHTLLGAFVRQFEARLDEKFSAQEEAAKDAARRWDARALEIEAQLRSLERGQADIKVEMLREYVRREDAIRDHTVTQAKLDALFARIELLSQMVARMEGK